MMTGLLAFGALAVATVVAIALAVRSWEESDRRGRAADPEESGFDREGE